MRYYFFAMFRAVRTVAETKVRTIMEVAALPPPLRSSTDGLRRWISAASEQRKPMMMSENGE